MLLLLLLFYSLERKLYYCGEGLGGKFIGSGGKLLLRHPLGLNPRLPPNVHPL